MAELERKYVIPLRKGFVNIQRYRRTSRAVRQVKEFLQQHMKVKDVRLMKELNEALHARGKKNPPHKIEVRVKKVQEKDVEYAVANITSAPLEIKKAEKKKEPRKVVAEKKEEQKEDSSAMKEEKKEVLEHAEHPEPEAPKVGDLPKAKRLSPKDAKVIPQSGKK